jgi:outer membrane PBP1 activator LpoA protein
MARNVTSPRFPMGVATTYNPGSNAASRGSPTRGVPESVAFAMSRFNALLLLFLTSVVSPAFSADAQPGTTITSPAATPADDEIDPATGLARSSVVKPLLSVPPVPDPRRSMAQPRAHVALILPTTSPTLGRLADAVRQGFMAAAEVEGRQAPVVNVVAIENEGAALLEACRNAQAAGAILVVAGITRDGASSLVRSDCLRQPVLALNEPQAAPNEIPANLYTVSLSAENEARQVALLAVSEGWHSAIVITSGTPLAKRVQEAFEREWTRAAGQVAGRLTFAGTAEDAPLVRDRMAGVRADMVFMALDGAEARAVRPYISGMLPLYGTSLSVNPRAEAIVNLDLQGMRYVEMPWFVQPDHPAVMVYPVPRSMSPEQERLYAFGIDAFRLSQQLLKGDKAAPVDGVTGKLALEPPTHFGRTLTPAEVDGGRVIPLRAP